MELLTPLPYMFVLCRVSLIKLADCLINSSTLPVSCIIVTWWSGAGGIQVLFARAIGFLQCFDTVGLVI